MSSLNPVNMARFWWMDHVSLCQSLKWKKTLMSGYTIKKMSPSPISIGQFEDNDSTLNKSKPRQPRPSRTDKSVETIRKDQF